jgi:putative membrane protein
VTLVELLPKINACLNGSSGLLLLGGVRAIKRGQRNVHERFVLSAVAASALFLVGYLTRVALQGTHRFAGQGLLRAAYFVILISHMILAVVVVPLVVRLLYLARRERFSEHRRLARLTFPIWMYVSVTGVIVYVMLYHFPGYIP